ncbi:MAG: M56 family metallopeptidase [Lachnospiraceae bacterium]|nr:M56 family metallopeptidase [Lachnospiraceae bacterium]
MNAVMWMQFFNFWAVYLVTQLGRSLLCSWVILAGIWVLRRSCLRKAIFGKGFLWTFLLLVPFVGKMKVFYENPIMVKYFFWWPNLCVMQSWICHLYLAGVLIHVFFMIGKNRKLKKFLSEMEMWEIENQTVFVSDMAVTPFATGLLRPKIVLPRSLLEQCEKEEIRWIILHEKTHIRLGHLWYYFLWEIFYCLLWPNIFLIFFRNDFREDLEHICDRAVILQSGREPRDYGRLLLKTFCLLQSDSMDMTAAFAGERGYEVLKRRIQKIAGFRIYSKVRVRCLCIGCAVFLIGVFAEIKCHSYPKYTNIEEWVLVDPLCQQVLISDRKEMEQAISIDQENVYVKPSAIRELFQKYGLEEQPFYFGFGGYMKLPGMGGGGNSVYVDYEKDEAVLILPYQEKEDLLIKILKVL